MRVFIQSYVTYLDFSWILRACLLVPFNYLFHLFVLYLSVRVFVLYLLCGCLIPNTLLWSLYVSWFQGPNIHLLFVLIPLSLIYLISFLIGMTPVIRSINFLKRFTCVGLVMKYHLILVMGHNSTFNSFLLIGSVMKKKQMLMCLVCLLLYDLQLFSRRMALLLSW